MLSISVAVYNLPEITRRCFESLERSLDGVPFEVLVVDNHSTDPAMQPFYASLDTARYKVLRSRTNIGYRGAHRENARHFSGDWFIIINNDLVFEELRWDRKLKRAEGIAAFGVKGDVCNAIAEDGAGYYDPRAVRAPMYIDGQFMAIPREMLLDQGLFEDEQIQFCYFEDADHCFTLRQKGYGFGFISVGLTHFRSSTVRSLAADERLFLLQTFERNRTRFLSKWAGEIRRLRADLSWDDVELEGCPKVPSAQTPVSSAAASLIQRGLEDHKAGRFAEAEALYRKAMSKSGGKSVPAADNLMAALMMDTARPDQARTYARRAVASEPGTAFYRTMLGNAEQAAGRLPDAFRSYLCALRLNPKDEYALYNLARLCLQCRMPDQAASFYRMALDISPPMSEAKYGLGRALVELGQLEDAVKLLRGVLDAFPAHEDAAIELSRLHINQGRYAEAETVLRAALKHLQDSHALHNNLGVALYKRGDARGAQVEFRVALSRVPDNPEYLTNAGLSLAAEEDLVGAIAAYRPAIEFAPDYAEAHWNLSLALLLSGEYTEGWREYRWGLRTKKPRAVGRNFERPPWDGSTLSDKRILLYTEQGYGDAFQFVRYATLFSERGGRVILQCQRGLRRLMCAVPGVETVIQEGDSLPEFDMHASIFDAPRVFGTTVESIPSGCGYIRPEKPLVEKWRTMMRALSGLKVGLTWQGRATHEHDHLRSISLRLLEPLLAADGVTFVSLQKGHGSEQITATAFKDRIVDNTTLWDREGEDIFLDCAAVIANLDLVITVDSAVAHLAGAMGSPVWTLIQFAPDWRWMLGRDDSPWYPSMRLFRQVHHGAWSTPIERVTSALQALRTGTTR